VTFISYRGRLTIMSEGVAREEKGSESGESQVRLSDIETDGIKERVNVPF